MSLDEREEIALGLATRHGFAGIGRQLGRPTSTVAREVARNGGRRRYRAGSTGVWSTASRN
ncbi:MAG: helix-turn-helix domain-containing protein [Haloechinothrix sp.]